MATASALCFQFTENGTCTFGSQCKFAHIGNRRGSGSRPQHHSRPRHKRRNHRQSTETHLDEFFAQYPTFPYYDDSASATSNFKRLCSFFDFDDRQRRIARGRFKDALVLQFNDIYGTDVDSINSWRSLCQVLNIDPIPEELEECRRRVQGTHVNIVDLVDKPGARVRVFNSVEELSEYTKMSEKFFPKENAYAGGVLKFLLREIINPPQSRRRRGA